MKYKLSIGILVMLVSMIMLMSNVMASGWPPMWMNQATLSVVDINPSRDPENSGFNTLQVSVWEDWNGIDWDIWMKYSLADGALGTWVFSPIQPATTIYLNEINPAVTVTNSNPNTGSTEIHVVYQRENPAFPGTWDICHTWTANFGIAWTVPVVLDSNPANDAIDPAIVYTDDLAPWTGGGGGANGMLVQFVWAEIVPPSIFYSIQYEAFYFDPTIGVPPNRGYVGVTLVAATGIGDCMVPEIASIDERTNGGALGAYDYYFAIVWQQTGFTNPPGGGWRFQWNVHYIDGTTQTSSGAAPFGMFVAFTAAAGQINGVNNVGDCYDPDIAATQDFQNPEEYYFHINYVYQIIGANPTYQIDSDYYVGPASTPTFGGFGPGGVQTAKGPTLSLLDRPTIASKLITINPTLFETWMCWEDSSVAGAAPDIWYRMGQCPGGGAFGFIPLAALVPYVQPLGSTEYNPELWNRNDAARMFPPFTHLVFDMTTGLGGNQEVEYIDP